MDEHERDAILVCLNTCSITRHVACRDRGSILRSSIRNLSRSSPSRPWEFRSSDASMGRQRFSGGRDAQLSSILLPKAKFSEKGRGGKKLNPMHFFFLSIFFFFGIHESSLLSSGNKIPPHSGRPRPSYPTNDATVFHRNDRPLIASRVPSFRAR